MSEINLIKSIVAICDSSGRVVGTGFIVTDDDLVATCAHVVQAANCGPGDVISLVFRATGQQAHATVIQEYWRTPMAEDVAFLRLEKLQSEGTAAIAFGSSSGTSSHPFKTFGFPVAKPEEGMWGYGTIGDRTAERGYPVQQLTGTTEVTAGFSGAPVLDTRSRRVIGMVTSITSPDLNGRLIETAFIIPIETLRAICPALQITDICPYRSLNAFTEANAEFFFGRERVIERLLEHLRREPRFLAVLGPSGSGKSSVVRAGLIAQLHEGKVAGSDRWGIFITRLADNPFDQLATQGLTGTNLQTAARNWLERNPENIRLVLVIDQFEELLVATPEPVRQTFIKEMSDLLEASLPITLILIMRDDFYSRFSKQALVLLPWLEIGLINIPADLTRDELSAMVQEPAKAVGLQFEQGLVEVIVSDSLETVPTTEESRRIGHSTILPLLEFTLAQLWERRQAGVLTHEAYNAIGGVTGGLTQWADHAWYALESELRPLARRILTDLVFLGDKSQGLPDSRRQRMLSSLARSEDEQEPVLYVVRHLADARLVVTARDETTGGQDTVEIVHETLIRGWERLWNWLNEDRVFLLWRQRLQITMRQWQVSHWDAGEALRGAPLVEAEKWLQIRRADLSQGEQAFITFSLALREDDSHKLALAREYYSKSLEADATLATEVHYRLYLLLLEEDKLAEALKEYDKAIGIKPELAIVPPRFHVVRIISAAGPFVVYQATDEKKRAVTIKVLKQAYEKEEVVELLTRVADLSNQLRHPNIVGVTEFGRIGSKYYIVREYVEGLSVREILDEEGPLALKMATDVVVQMCSALKAIHAQGVVHGNIKPTNIFRTDTQIKLTDFGSAVIRDATDYMAPEQGQGREIPQSDIFAVATVFREMLIGRNPSQGDSRSGLDDTLELFLEIARTHTPEDRYPSVAAFLGELSWVVPMQVVGKSAMQPRRLIALTAQTLKTSIKRSWRWLLVVPIMLGLLAPLMGEAYILREVARTASVLLTLTLALTTLASWLAMIVARRERSALIAACGGAMGLLLALAIGPLWLNSIGFRSSNALPDPRNFCSPDYLLPLGLGRIDDLQYLGQALPTYLAGSLVTALGVFVSIWAAGALTKRLGRRYTTGYFAVFLLWILILVLAILGLGYGWFGCS